MKKSIFQKFSASIIGLFFIAFILTPVLASDKTKPIELKVSSWSPPQLPIVKLTEEWGRKIEEKSGGSVKLVFYWAQTLATYKDSYRVMQAGVADIGNYVIGQLPGIHPLNEYTALPLIGYKNIEVATKVYHEMRKKFPQLDAEFKGLRNIYTTAMPANQFHLTHKTVKELDDIRGTRIIAGAYWTELISALNAVSIAKGPPDWYMSLQKGLADGQLVHWPAVDGFKLEELFATHTEAGDGGFGLSMYGWWINEKSWNKLPPQAQNAFMELQDWVQDADLKLNTELIEKGREVARKMNHPIYQLSPEETAKWAKIVQPLHDKWVADLEAQGLPGKAVYAEAHRLIERYNKE